MDREKSLSYIGDNLKDLYDDFPNSLSNVRSYAECGSGWKPLIRKCLEVYEKHGAKVAQIKEKFGGLRIYFDLPDDLSDRDDVWKICWEAEKEAEDASFKICEDCGSAGVIRNVSGWLRTLCDPCHVRCEEERKRRVAEYRAQQEAKKQKQSGVLAEQTPPESEGKK